MKNATIIFKKPKVELQNKPTEISHAYCKHLLKTPKEELRNNPIEIARTNKDIVVKPLKTQKKRKWMRVKGRNLTKSNDLMPSKYGIPGGSESINSVRFFKWDPDELPAAICSTHSTENVSGGSWTETHNLIFLSQNLMCIA
jgi:hypothetical protein